MLNFEVTSCSIDSSVMPLGPEAPLGPGFVPQDDTKTTKTQDCADDGVGRLVHLPLTATELHQALFLLTDAMWARRKEDSEPEPSKCRFSDPNTKEPYIRLSPELGHAHLHLPQRMIKCRINHPKLQVPDIPNATGFPEPSQRPKSPEN